MKNSKHTPGPWRWIKYNQPHDTGEYQSWHLTGKLDKDTGYHDSEVMRVDITVPDDADANLIAAAPEMLEALECIAELFSDDDKFNDLNCRRIAIKKYRQAIAKARGKS